MSYTQNQGYDLFSEHSSSLIHNSNQPNSIEPNSNHPYHQRGTKLSEVFGSPTRNVIQPSKDDMLLSSVKMFQKNFNDHTQPLLYLIEKHLKNINNILVYNYPLTTFIQIELDSSYRNRKEYPLQADFIIPFTNGSVSRSFSNSNNTFLSSPYYNTGTIPYYPTSSIAYNSVDPVFNGIPFANI